jgi:hypothetical protein
MKSVDGEVYFCRLEYWVPSKGEWDVGHVGVNLLHPRRYAERLAARGKVGRVIVVDTGEVIQPLDPKEPEAEMLCNICETIHAAPYDGSCLLL